MSAHWQPRLREASAGVQNTGRVPTRAYAATSAYAESDADLSRALLLTLFKAKHAYANLRRTLNSLQGLPTRSFSPLELLMLCLRSIREFPPEY